MVMVVQLCEYANHWIGGCYVSGLYGIWTTSQLGCFWKVLAILKVKVLATQLCPTFSDPVDYSLPGSSVHGILQERILEWVAIPFSKESPRPRDRSCNSCTAGRFFPVWAAREAQSLLKISLYVCVCVANLGHFLTTLTSPVLPNSFSCLIFPYSVYHRLI